MRQYFYELRYDGDTYFFILQVVQLIRDDILSHACSMPPEFVKKIMQLLNKGSIHATPSDQFIGKEYTYVLHLILSHT